MKDLLNGLDPRLYVVIGKDAVLRTPCVGECADCTQKTEPVPPEGKLFCKRYIYPSAKWVGLNAEGNPKICPTVYKAPVEKELRMNPLKMSRRGLKQISSVPAAFNKAANKK